MKTKLLLLITVMLLSSCSIFRKSEKHKLEVKSSVEVEQTIIANENNKEVENTERQKATVTDSESNTNTSIEADEVVFNPDGSISAKGNVKANQNRNDKNSASSQENETKRKETDTQKLTDTNLKLTDKVELEVMDKIPEEAKNPIWHWIGFGLFVVIIGLAAMAYFRVR